MTTITFARIPVCSPLGIRTDSHRCSDVLGIRRVNIGTRGGRKPSTSLVANPGKKNTTSETMARNATSLSSQSIPSARSAFLGSLSRRHVACSYCRATLGHLWQARSRNSRPVNKDRGYPREPRARLGARKALRFCEQKCRDVVHKGEKLEPKFSFSLSLSPSRLPPPTMGAWNENIIGPIDMVVRILALCRTERP